MPMENNEQNSYSIGVLKNFIENCLKLQSKKYTSNEVNWVWNVYRHENKNKITLKCETALTSLKQVHSVKYTFYANQYH